MHWLNHTNNSALTFFESIGLLHILEQILHTYGKKGVVYSVFIKIQSQRYEKWLEGATHELCSTPGYTSSNWCDWKV